MDQLKKLDGHRVKTSEDVEKEALRKAEAAIAELKTLGLSYSLTKRKTPAARGKKKKFVPEEQLGFSFS